MDRTIPFLCCTILLILHTSSGSISRTAVGAFLEAIQREWNNCNHLPSNGELKNCIEDLQTVEDFNEDTIDEGRVVISRVCHKNISLVNLVSTVPLKKESAMIVLLHLQANFRLLRILFFPIVQSIDKRLIFGYFVFV